MNWDQIKGDWKQFKGKVKEKWGKLTDDDLNVVAGKRTSLPAKYKRDTASKKNKPRKNSMSSVARASRDLSSFCHCQAAAGWCRTSGAKAAAYSEEV